MSQNQPNAASSHVHHRRTLLRRLLVAAREDARLTQRTVAKSLGRPQSFVSKYEQGGRKLDVGEFMQLCAVLGCDPVAMLRTLARDARPRVRRGGPAGRSDRSG